MTPTEILTSPRLAELIARVIDREGRTFTDDKSDRGGATKFGQTQSFLVDVLGRPVSREEIRNLTEDQARIYYAMFIGKYGLWRLTAPRLLDHVADFAVHSGPGGPIRALQAAVGVSPDGVLGPMTAAAANGGDVELVCDRVMARRLEILGALLKRPDQGGYALGWLRRIGQLLVWRPA